MWVKKSDYQALVSRVDTCERLSLGCCVKNEKAIGLILDHLKMAVWVTEAKPAETILITQKEHVENTERSRKAQADFISAMYNQQMAGLRDPWGRF